MARIYRQVDIILQNHTVELLTLESALALQGEWIAPAPVIGSVVAAQGAGRWASATEDVYGATEGILRFGSTLGYAELHWSLPHDVLERTFRASAPEGMVQHHQIKGPSSDRAVFVVVLSRT